EAVGPARTKRCGAKSRRIVTVFKRPAEWQTPLEYFLAGMECGSLWASGLPAPGKVQTERPFQPLEVPAAHANGLGVGIALEHQHGVGVDRLVKDNRQTVEIAEGRDDAQLAVAEHGFKFAAGCQANRLAEGGGQGPRIDVVRGGK